MFRQANVLLLIVIVSFTLSDVFWVQGQRPEFPTVPYQTIKPIEVSPTKQSSRPQRMREGTSFKDKYVFFKQTGDQTVLYTVDDEQRFTCLKNLTLERILTTIQEKPERKYWKIDGEYTEFRGENFVLIRRAFVAPAPNVNIPVVP